MFCVTMRNEEVDMVVGYATSEAKAKKMIEILRDLDGDEPCYEYAYVKVFTDTLLVNDEEIRID